MRSFRTVVLAVLACVSIAAAPCQDFNSEVKDVPFLESPEFIVEAMLDLARVTDRDVVYDLGSGDGRIAIAAAADHGARAVGIEIEPGLIELSDDNARAAGVSARVKFVRADFFEADFREATVVTLYLRRKVNAKLRPLLAQQLAPGTRIVSHKYEIPGWTPAERIKVVGRWIYLYVVPPRRSPP